jgi:hypothetical protein
MGFRRAYALKTRPTLIRLLKVATELTQPIHSRCLGAWFGRWFGAFLFAWLW